MGTVTCEPRLGDDQQQQQVELDYSSSFRTNVLCLAQGITDEAWEGELLARAEEIGLELDSASSSSSSLPPLALRPTTAAVKRQSNLTACSRLSRRSASMYSSTSQSTDLTSIFSETSRDIYVTKRKRQSGVSLSLHDYDTFLARGKTDQLKTAISFSTESAPTDSALSLPLFSPETPPRRPSRVLKGLSRLRLHRLDQAWAPIDGCPHCPRNLLVTRRAVHKLPCGHRLCTQALRNTIKCALEGEADAVPGCCGLPISGMLIQHALTYEEQEVLLHKLEQWDDTVSMASSMPAEAGDSSPSLRADTSPRDAASPDSNKVLTEIVHDELSGVHNREDFKLLNEEQSGLRDRFLTWESTERHRMQASHHGRRQRMRILHDSLEEEKLDSNAQAIVEAEDRQVKAEADLRIAHEQEKRDNATALKHLEAYCAGEYSSGEAHNRVVTDQGRAELAKAKKIRETMDAKHESAINVLRGEQARRMTLRQQRQHRELQDVRRTHRIEQLSFERVCNAELLAFETCLVENQAKLSRRWTIQNAVFAKQLELQTGIVLAGGSMPLLAWPEHRLDDVPRSSGSMLDTERALIPAQG